jgi:hypothetical protein
MPKWGRRDYSPNTKSLEGIIGIAERTKLAKILDQLVEFRFMDTASYAMRAHPNVSGLAAWSENCKLYSSLPLGEVVSPFYYSV